MSDPKYVSGLVHLMEHAISVASAKYPEDNSYQSFLTKNGGRSNAYAYASMTRFYFEIVPEKFEEALDRFSQHFISPLFPEAAVAREIKVVIYHLIMLSFVLHYSIVLYSIVHYI